MPVSLSYADRIPFCKNVVGKKLLKLIHDKKTNLALSADVTRCEEVLALADLLGPEICVLKTHVDILENFTLNFTHQLRVLADKHQFLIFEDRKFADIGNTVKLQYEKGIYHIVDWADMVNAHTLPGPGIISGLAAAGLSKQRGLLLLAEMSSAGNLFSESYIQQTLAMADKFPEFVFGFIAQRRLNDHPGHIYMTPGVQLEEGTDALGQQYVTPEKAIFENRSDIIIVGRGIIKAHDPLKEAKRYRERAYSPLPPQSY